MSTIRIICFILCQLVWPSMYISAQTKRALVIGLGTQLDVSWGKINGDKDVPLVLSLLLDSGYKQDYIVTLVNSQATKNQYFVNNYVIV